MESPKGLSDYPLLPLHTRLALCKILVHLPKMRIRAMIHVPCHYLLVIHTCAVCLQGVECHLWGSTSAYMSLYSSFSSMTCVSMMLDTVCNNDLEVQDVHVHKQKLYLAQCIQVFLCYRGKSPVLDREELKQVILCQLQQPGAYIALVSQP